MVLLSGHLTGKDFVDAKKILDSTVASDMIETERLEANHLASTVGVEHSAISFHLMPTGFSTPVNWREENRSFFDLTSSSRTSYTKPFSYLTLSSSNTTL